MVNNCEDSAAIDLVLGQAIKDVWADAAMQRVMNRRENIEKYSGRTGKKEKKNTRKFCERQKTFRVIENLEPRSQVDRSSVAFSCIIFAAVDQRVMIRRCAYVLYEGRKGMYPDTNG